MLNEAGQSVVQLSFNRPFRSAARVYHANRQFAIILSWPPVAMRAAAIIATANLT